MSTTFGVYIKDINITLVNDDLPEFDDEGNIIDIEDDFVEVFYRGMGYCRFKSDLAIFLPEDLKVYPLDNTAQGIYTIGDCKKDFYEYLDENKIIYK